MASRCASGKLLAFGPELCFSQWRMSPVAERQTTGSRRRYDTVALMGELRRERRTAIILGIVGVTIFAGLIALFLLSREQELPTTSTGATQLGSSMPAVVHETTVTAPVAQPPPPPPPVEQEPPPPPAPAALKLVMPKKAVITLDGKTLARSKDDKLQLPAGAHDVKVKLGKKNAQSTVTVEPGGVYELRLDPKANKLTLKKRK